MTLAVVVGTAKPRTTNAEISSRASDTARAEGTANNIQFAHESGTSFLMLSEAFPVAFLRRLEAGGTQRQNLIRCVHEGQPQNNCERESWEHVTALEHLES